MTPAQSTAQKASNTIPMTGQGKSPSEKQQADELNVMEIPKNRKKLIGKDSLDDTPQKVIVVKKVIRRDTIFIEK